MKNEIPTLLMDDKICFVRLVPNTVQNFQHVIMSLCCYGILVHVSGSPTLKVLTSKVNGP